MAKICKSLTEMFGWREKERAKLESLLNIERDLTQLLCLELCKATKEKILRCVGYHMRNTETCGRDEKLALGVQRLTQVLR